MANGRVGACRQRTTEALRQKLTDRTLTEERCVRSGGDPRGKQLNGTWVTGKGIEHRLRTGNAGALPRGLAGADQGGPRLAQNFVNDQSIKTSPAAHAAVESGGAGAEFRRNVAYAQLLWICVIEDLYRSGNDCLNTDGWAPPAFSAWSGDLIPPCRASR